MPKRVLITATVQSHICQFHKPLMKLLKENGYEVHIAARNNLAEKNGLTIEYADEVFDVPFDRSPFSLRNLTAYRQLAAILKNNRYDVIHTNTPMGGMVTRLAANKYRKRNATKVFYTAHGFHFYKGAPVKNWLIYYPIEKMMSYFTDRLITITTEDYALASNIFHCDVVHMHGVGANSSKFYIMTENDRETLRKELGFSRDDIIVLNVGELLPNKNQITAIYTLKELKKRRDNIKLLIAGNGPEYENLRQAVTNCGLDDSVVFLGYTLELDKYMNIADVLIACSYREGLPLNLMEAMLCGLPVVASDNRGHRELVDDGKNGYLADVTNPADYAEKIEKVLNNRNKYSEYAVLKVQQFTDVSVIEELKELYEL